MRNLVLLLLLANALYWAWEHWLKPENSSVEVVAPTAQGLTLVSEVEPVTEPSVAPEVVAEEVLAPEAAATEEVAVAAAPVAEPQCVSLGPFRDLPEAANVGSNLKRAGLKSRQRVGEGDIWIGHWVHIDNLGSRATAEGVLARLREGGVSDSYIVSDDGSQGISLGVFSEIKRAGTRRQQVQELGFAPVVTDRSRRGTVYWVDVDLEADQELDLASLQQGRIVRINEGGCETG
jgi:hypothetical protein